MLKKLCALFLCVSTLSAQTHTIPTTDRNTTWTGQETFTSGNILIVPGTYVACTAGILGAIQNIGYTDTAHLIDNPGHDQYQQCAQTGASTYEWVPVGGGGTASGFSNNLGVGASGTGTLVSTPEAGFTTSGSYALKAWSDDFSRGIFDPRDTQWAGGVNGSTPAAAWQSVFDAAACYVAQNGKNSTIIAPPGTWNVGTATRPSLTLGPGIALIGASGGSYGSTTFQATYLGNGTFQMYSPYTVPVCPNGATNVVDNADGGYITNINESGCLFVACSNVPGHSTTAGDGLAQVGINIEGEHNEVGNLHAVGNLGAGIIIQGTDTTVKGHLLSYSNDAWLVEQKGPAPDTYNPATDGVHGDVELYGVDATNSDIETYGFLVQPGTEAGHLSGVLLGGGNTSAANLFIQLAEYGIAGDGGAGLQRVSNFRIDGSWLDGIASRNATVIWSNGLIDGYCLSSTAGTCDGIASGTGFNEFNDITLTRSNGFGTSYATGDMCVADQSRVTNVTADGGLGPIPDVTYGCNYGNPAGYHTIYEPPDVPTFGGGTVLTGATPSFLGVKHVIMQNTSATNITAPTNVLVQRDYTITLSSSNDVLVSTTNGGNFVTCSGYNITGPRTAMRFTGTQADAYHPQYLTESCEDKENVNWYVGSQGKTLPSTDLLPSFLAFGSAAVAPLPALSAPSGQGIGAPTQTSCYDVKVYVAGGIQTNSPVCLNYNIPVTSGPSTNVQVFQVLPINTTRYVVYRESTTQSGLSPGTIADVTLPAPVTVPTTVNVFDTTTSTINSTILGTANQGINMTGTYNFDPTNIPTTTSYLCVPGQVKIDPTPSTGALYYCASENSWVKAPLSFTSSF
jgi:hypothetical protein